MVISSRLNLMEGDVQIMITAADGVRQIVYGAGGQPDTALRQVALSPGQQVIGVINLLYTSLGLTFSEAGRYTLQAEYAPSPRVNPYLSSPVSMELRSPQSKDELEVSALLQKEEAKYALTLAEPSSARDELKILATRFTDTLDGKLALLVLAGDNEAEYTASLSVLFSTVDLITMALWIRAVSTPFSSVGKHLTEKFSEYVETHDATAKYPELEIKRALSIAKGHPVTAD